MLNVIWHNLPIHEIFSILKTKETGLAETEVHRRLIKHGPNKITEKSKESSVKSFINQLKSPLVYILIIAAFISLILQQWIDFGVISFVVILNSCVGFLQEYKANRSLSLLKKALVLKTKVLRDGLEKVIECDKLVPGDIMLLTSGDKVGADARLLQTISLSANESQLTGESFPVMKTNLTMEVGTVLAERKNMVYMGTTIVAGKGTAIVCETGKYTEIGKIAQYVSEIEDQPTPLQIQLKKFSQFFTLVIAAIAIFIFFIGTLQNRTGMLYIVMALSVAAIPEGLLIAVTSILARGMQIILQKQALVRKLLAAETLGCTSVICTDKTGTLTEGKMEV